MHATPHPKQTTVLFAAILGALALSACHTSARDDAPSAGQADTRGDRHAAQSTPSPADV
ncbi:MAG: hypothetical protein HOQ32_03915, partial [Lysobacter sp.]|nr:hypothetical protein [Lysobacter sp.]